MCSSQRSDAEAPASGVVVLSPVYTVDNLFNEFIREQGLFHFDDDGNVSEEGGHARELELLLELNMEGTGLRASQMCMGWALAVVAEARRRGRLEKPEGVTLGNKLLNLEADGTITQRRTTRPFSRVLPLCSTTTGTSTKVS